MKLGFLITGRMVKVTLVTQKKDALYLLGILLINHQKFINSLLIITKPDVLCTGPRVRPYAH